MKPEELMNKIEEVQKNPPMTIDEAVKMLGMYESAGEFVQVMTVVLYHLINGDEDTAKEIATPFLGHVMYVLDKVGQGEVAQYKNDLLKAMKEQAMAEYQEAQKNIPAPVVIPANPRKKKK